MTKSQQETMEAMQERTAVTVNNEINQLFNDHVERSTEENIAAIRGVQRLASGLFQSLCITRKQLEKVTAIANFAVEAMQERG